MCLHIQEQAYAYMHVCVVPYVSVGLCTCMYISVYNKYVQMCMGAYEVLSCPAKWVSCMTQFSFGDKHYILQQGFP